MAVIEQNPNPIVYLNGQFLPLEQAKVSPLDRGMVFGDGVYEVLPAYNGKVFSLKPHIERLNQSLHEIHMKPPLNLEDWRFILDGVVTRNGGGDLLIYIQVTRGFELVRTHKIPNHINPTIFVVCYPKPLPTKSEQAKGIAVVTVNDNRWKRCDIKTTARLAYVMMYQEMINKGADEGIIINNGFAVEGIISNIYMVKGGIVVTPPKSNHILSGITREFMLGLAKELNIACQEMPISVQDLADADEIWISNSTRGVCPVATIDGKAVGNGKSWPVWERMWDAYVELIVKNI